MMAEVSAELAGVAREVAPPASVRLERHLDMWAAPFIEHQIARAIWSKMNALERYGISIGLFPINKVPAHTPHEVIKALMVIPVIAAQYPEARTC